MKTNKALVIALILSFGFVAPQATPAHAAEAQTGSDRPLLLDFSATWCGPCRQMRPEIARLKEQGLPVKEIDIDHSPALAARYRITGVPAFLFVDADGRVLERTEGAQSGANILALYRKAKAKLLRDGSTAETRRAKAPRGDEELEPKGIDFESEPDRAPKADRAADSDKNPEPWKTVVRIKVSAPGGMMEFGSGTIVSSTDDEAIILTCAHIFHIDGAAKQARPERFPYQIMIDLFDGRLAGPRKNTVHPVETLPGKALDYDFVHDVGLIRIKTRRRLPCSPVVPPAWQPKPGMNLIAVGCPEGQDATAWSTKILHTRMGNPNAVSTGRASYEGLLCTNAPRQGRSGGGLYNENGYVVGVCDFADYRNNHGIYASSDSIRRLLDRNNLSFVYDRSPSRGSESLVVEADRPRRVRDDDEPIYRGQNPVEAAAEPRSRSKTITIPKPEMLGIPSPRFVSNSNSGEEESARKRGWTQARESAVNDAPVRAERAAITMDADVDPQAQAEGPPADEKAEPAPAPSRETTPRKGKWRAVQSR